MGGWDGLCAPHCGEEERARGAYPYFSRFCLLRTILLMYLKSASHSRPFSGLLFYQLNLALTGTEGFFDPTLALSSIYLLSRLDRKRKTPNPESRSYLHMIGITTYIIRAFSAHDAKIFFNSYESEWRI